MPHTVIGAQEGAVMRNRHFPRLCRHCRAPMARQQDSCWRCGTAWATEDMPRTTLRVRLEVAEHELEDLRAIRDALTPPELPGRPGLELAAAFLPAEAERHPLGVRRPAVAAPDPRRRGR